MRGGHLGREVEKVLEDGELWEEEIKKKRNSHRILERLGNVRYQVSWKAGWTETRKIS